MTANKVMITDKIPSFSNIFIFFLRVWSIQIYSFYSANMHCTLRIIAIHIKCIHILIKRVNSERCWFRRMIMSDLHLKLSGIRFNSNRFEFNWIRWYVCMCLPNKAQCLLNTCLNRLNRFFRNRWKRDTYTDQLSRSPNTINNFYLWTTDKQQSIHAYSFSSNGCFTFSIKISTFQYERERLKR